MPQSERDVTGDNSLELGVKARRAPQTVWPKIDTSELAVTKMAPALSDFKLAGRKQAILNRTENS